jgi:hypothetical protein
MRGDLIYHCRNCGKYFVRYTVPDLDVAMALIADDERTPRGWGRPAAGTATHACNDAAIGLADLVRGDYTPAAGTEGG